MSDEDSHTKELTDRITQLIENEFDGTFIPIPKEACQCGKPVVFVQGRKKFECTRCGAEWELTIKVECTKKGSQ